MSHRLVRFKVNGLERQVSAAPHDTLVNLLREELGLTGTKEGCGTGECGACTVLLDGESVNSCLVLAVACEGREVTTIEGLAVDGEFHPVQSAFVEKGAIQCGYCTPGMVMAAVSLLDRSPQPSEAEIRAALEGNLCRCTGYAKIVEAIKEAADRLSTPGTPETEQRR